jgi:hypothetical protein
MRTVRFGYLLTVVNLAILVFLAAQGGMANAQGAPETALVLRGRALALVDEQGQVRARLNIEPDGEVVYRLFDAKGTLRVKLGAGATGSGLLLADEHTEPGVHIIARRAPAPDRPTTTSITLRAAPWRERVLKP